MTKITFIGAGSLGFTAGLVRDILTFPLLQDATIALMDIDAERLAWAKKGVEKLIAAVNSPARVEATLDRAEALKDADVVLTTILSGSTEVWRHDIEIPKKYGVDINVGDTRGPSGIFRFLRTLPDMLEIVRDMERHCPKAVLLNYTNPMAMLCAAIQRQTFIPVTGLCHSVQGTAMMLADWIGAPYEQIDYTCAGINHQAWYLEFKWNGEDAYPQIQEAVRERGRIAVAKGSRSGTFQPALDRRESARHPVAVPALDRGVVLPQGIAEIAQHREVVQRLNLAGNRLHDRPHPRPAGGVRRQQGRRRKTLLEVLGDRHRLHDHALADRQGRNQAERVDRAVFRPFLLPAVAHQMHHFLLVRDALEVQGDPHAIGRRRPPVAIEQDRFSRHNVEFPVRWRRRSRRRPRPAFRCG